MTVVCLLAVCVAACTKAHLQLACCEDVDGTVRLRRSGLDNGGTLLYPLHDQDVLTSANVARASFVAAPRLPNCSKPSSCTLGMPSEPGAMLPMHPQLHCCSSIGSGCCSWYLALRWSLTRHHASDLAQRVRELVLLRWSHTCYLPCKLTRCPGWYRSQAGEFWRRQKFRMCGVDRTAAAPGATLHLQTHSRALKLTCVIAKTFLVYKTHEAHVHL